MSRVPARILALLCAASMIGFSSAPVLARSSQARVWITPSHATIGRTATLSATHVHANHYFTFVLYAPKGAKPRAAFIGQGKASKRGSIHTTVHIPIVTRCGNAKVSIYDAAAKQLVWTKLTLTGCKAKRSGGPPSPP